ncbi:MAG: porin [Rhodocyclaceae bacterium]|nr:porin [Rhodocyclaceae bacterium]
MQKKIIALAVAGLVSGAAFAQTNVTVYGVADASFESASVSGAAYNSNLNRDGFRRVNTNSSLIGFRGTEDLGGGLKAIFQFESGANFDSAGGLSLGRDSFVGLVSNFGTVRLGNLTGPTRALGANVDLNAGSTTPGANSSLIGKVLGGNAMVAGTTAVTGAVANTYAIGDAYNNGAAGYNSSTFDTRLTNAIAYSSPSFAGFTLQGAYSVGENKNLDTNNNTPREVDTKTYDVGVIYNNGPIYAGLTHGKVDANRDATYASCAVVSNLGTCVAEATSITRLAGKYTLPGGHQVAALWERNRAEYNAPANIAALGVAAPGFNVTQSVWGLGGKFVVTPALALIGQYYKAKDASISNSADDGDTSAKLWQLGAEYSLSKRTMVKAAYVQMNNGDDVANDFNVGAVGGGFGTGAKLKVWSLGLRHTF